jgi:hypothetical protein
MSKKKSPFVSTIVDGEVSPARYPLNWPPSKARTPAERRRVDRFKVDFVDAWNSLIDETDKILSVADITIHTNIPLRENGLPVVALARKADPGVVLRYTRNAVPYVIALDHYTEARANIRALGITVRNLREIERHGAPELFEQATAGFLALPPASSETVEPPWYEVLEVQPDATAADVESSYRALARKHHPDAGGSNDMFCRLGRARMQAEHAVAQRAHVGMSIGVNSRIG